MTTIAELRIGGDAAAWRDVGFDVDAVGHVQLGGVRLVVEDGPPGLQRWVLADARLADVSDIDGLVTEHGEPPMAASAAHPNGVLGIDHVVVYTPDLEQTCGAIADATGCELRRVREAGSLRQGFHRLGEVIVEVVNFPDITVKRATFWGLALNVDDIDALYERCGPDALSAPKDAVQPGRRIASFRESAGLGLPVAVMTAPPARR